MKISVAYIKGPRGFKGELAAVLYNPASKSIRAGLEITLQKGEKSGLFVVEFTKSLKNRIGLKLKGIEDNVSAEYWKGAEVLVDKDKLEPLEESEYYHFEIEGAEVYDEKGKLLGTVNHVDSNAGNSILYIDTGHEEILIPFVKAFVDSIDVDKKTIKMKNLDGLI